MSLVCTSNSNSLLNIIVMDTQCHGSFNQEELRFDVISSGRDTYNGGGSDAVDTNRILFLIFHHVSKIGEMDVLTRFIYI